MQKHYAIPFSFEDLLMQKKGKLTCSLEESIRQHISLIIMTKFGAFRFDPTFGCKIWDVDFIVPSNLNTWKDEIKESLQGAITQHENRIEEITRFDVSVKRTGKHARVNQRLDIELECTIKGTNDACYYSETLYFSPYSLI